MAELVEPRVAYLTEDNGELGKDGEVAIGNGLPGYCEAHLDRDLHAYVIREEGQIVSCALLIVVEKPVSFAFMSGRTGVVLNAYTQPGRRRKGHARRVLESKAQPMTCSSRGSAAKGAA